MEITFPVSTAPGVNPTENGGRLINAYAETVAQGGRSGIVWRRAPGLRTIFETEEIEPRGAIVVGAKLYIVSGDKVYVVLETAGEYVVTECTGTIGGSGPAYLAQNMNATTQVLIVHSAGMAQINTSTDTVSSFSDADLPAANSICWTDTYFVVTSQDGRMFASANNDITFASTDFATAESEPDGLVRAVAVGGNLLAMGFSSIEFWNVSADATGFPFTRGPVLSVGLLGPQAIAGFEPGFSDTVIFVASDRTVRRLDGYSPIIISTPDLQRLIEAVEDVDDIQCSVFVAAGHQFCQINGPSWTWVYDISEQRWHERKSYGSDRARNVYSVRAFDDWLTFDRDSGKVFRIESEYQKEDGGPLVWELRSTQAHRFPGRFFVRLASFDFVTGVGDDAGIDPIETNPRVLISWSDDGGRTFGSPVERELGTEGQDVTIEVNRVGVTGPRGRQWRLQISDPVQIGFMGAAMDVQERAA